MIGPFGEWCYWSGHLVLSHSKMFHVLEVQHLLVVYWCFGCYCFQILTNVLPISLSVLITKFVIIFLEGPRVFAPTIDMGTIAQYVSNNIWCHRGLFGGTCNFLVYRFLSRGKLSGKLTCEKYKLFAINRVPQNTAKRNLTSRDSPAELALASH